MPVELVGAHRTWDGSVITSDLQNRFARALGVAGPQPAQSCVVADTFVAATARKRGWKPWQTSDGSHVLFAGHIDNRRELSRELGISADCDAQVYVAGLAAWGDAIDLRAIGQFAAIVILPHGKAIRLMRSPIAAPPLHYWHDSRRFIVASLSSAIFATGEVEQRIDQQKIADSLFLNYNEGTRSWFEGVSRLACGSRATANQKGLSVETFYDVTALPPVRFEDERDYVIAANELLEKGVRAALDGFSRPAITLSGGFDSQAVAALVARSRPGQPIEAFTSVPEADWDGVTYPSVFGDERAHVEALVAMYPEIRPHWIDAKGLFLDHKLTAMFMFAGCPPTNAANAHWAHEAHGQARASGCDVMLNGNFGNASFSFDGDGTLATLARQGKGLRLWKEAGPVGSSISKSRFRTIVSSAVLPFAPNWLHAMLVVTGLIKINDPFETWCPLNREFAEQMDLANRGRLEGHDPLFRNPASSREWRDNLVTKQSEDSADLRQAVTLIHGVESRDPTAYRPLVEFCLTIPDDQYLRNGVSRRLARRMLKGVIPDMVLDETRSGAQTADWHLRLGRQRGELIAEIDRLAEDSSMARMLNLGALRQSLADWPESPLGPSTPRLKLALTRGLTTARFIRFIEGRNA